jgi:hypothetical protein
MREPLRSGGSSGDSWHDSYWQTVPGARNIWRVIDWVCSIPFTE